MKHIEIEAIMTAKVAEYITKGYTFSTTTMSGHQGEIAKIDLRKGDEVIRVMLATETEWTDNGTREVVIFTIGRSTENVIDDAHPFNTMDKTFWNSDIKRNAGAKLSPRTQTELEANVQNRLDYLSSAPSVIASFFQALFTQYAA